VFGVFRLHVVSGLIYVQHIYQNGSYG